MDLGRTAFPAHHILYTPVVLCGGLRSAGLFHFGMHIVVVLAQLLLRQPRLCDFKGVASNITRRHHLTGNSERFLAECGSSWYSFIHIVV